MNNRLVYNDCKYNSYFERRVKNQEVKNQDRGKKRESKMGKPRIKKNIRIAPKFFAALQCT